MPCILFANDYKKTAAIHVAIDYPPHRCCWVLLLVCRTFTATTTTAATTTIHTPTPKNNRWEPVQLCYAYICPSILSYSPLLSLSLSLFLFYFFPVSLYLHMTEIAFEHFDPAIELCSVDANGRLVRPRKKPGRKPNPPSPAQRKAQNRAAQRAFRERKRREMKDAEFKVQRALCARDEAVREAKKLRRRVKQLEFENNFLRGHVLSLKMACYANRVDVDNYVHRGTRDYLGNEKMQKSAARGIPANLEFFLDHDYHVIYLQDDYIPPSIDNNSSTTHSPEPSSIGSASSPSSINTTSAPSSCAFNPFEALLLEPKLLARGQHAMPGSFDDMTDPTMMEPLPPLDLTQTVSVLAPQLHQLQQAYNGQLVDPSIIQGLVHTQMVSGLMDQITKPDFTIDQIPPELAALIPSEWRSSLHDYNARTPSLHTQTNSKPPSEEIAEIWDQLLNQQPLPPTKKSRCTIGPNGERTYPPMTPIEFVEELRLIPRKDKKFLTMFEPSKLCILHYHHHFLLTMT